jgi:hypothetical protein
VAVGGFMRVLKQPTKISKQSKSLKKKKVDSYMLKVKSYKNINKMSFRRRKRTRESHFFPEGAIFVWSFLVIIWFLLLQSLETKQN